jgi:hypothetical protein
MAPRSLIEAADKSVRLARDHADALGLLGPGQCLVLASLTTSYLVRQGIDAYMQAGTCLWPIVGPYDETWHEAIERAERVHTVPTEEETKGKLCFGFEWEPDNPKSQELMRNGLAPEYHAWVAVPVPGKGANEALIIDAGVKEIMAFARRDGLPVDHSKGGPPDWWIGEGDLMPHGCRYLAVDEACRFAYDYAAKFTIEQFDTHYERYSFAAYAIHPSRRAEHEARLPQPLRISA